MFKILIVILSIIKIKYSKNKKNKYVYQKIRNKYIKIKNISKVK